MKLLRILSIILLLVNSLASFAGGFSMITDPSGQSINLCTDCLEHTPFSDYFIPGLILLLSNGVSGFIVFGAVMIRHKHYPWFIIYQGCVLTVWILVQMMMLQVTNYLQLVFGIIGIVLILTGSIQTSSKNPLIKNRK